jgi:import inner membrane translocase subunit TIM50
MQMHKYFSINLIKLSNSCKCNKNFSVFLRKNKNNLACNFLNNRNARFSTHEKSNEKEDKTSNQQEETNKNEEQKNEDEYNEEPQANYKTSRRIRYGFVKLIKYIFMGFTGITLWNFYLSRNKDKPQQSYGYFEPSIKLINSIDYLWFLTYGTLTLPYYKKVLPDALELKDGPSKKTLVINLNKTLINYEYKFGSGFEILKRPGLLKFLQEMGQIYEVVIFGTEDSNFVEEVTGKLDQFEMNIRYKLGKEATRLVNRRYVKDLDYLNRDLKNVICIDFDPNNVMYHPENTLIIPEFNGDGKDKELIQAIVFLKEMAKPDIKDVRNEFKRLGNYRTYINFYKSNPKFKKLLPKEDYVSDDADLQAVINKK